MKFINCLATPGGEGFRVVDYSEPGYAKHCVSTYGTATIWDSGPGDEANSANRVGSFVNANGGDFHLASADKGARVEEDPDWAKT